MNKFDLSFKGDIQPGYDPGQVKARFGKLFGIDDPVRLERFFSGDTIILRRNLERKVAAEYYAKLRKLGVESELIKITPEEAAAKASEATISSPEKAAQQAAWEQARRDAEFDVVRRKAREEETRRKAEEDAARLKALEEEARSKAEEEAARRKALEEEARRKAEEKAARRKALEEEARRKAEEEAARRKAQEEEARRKAEEEAARRKAQEEEARRKAEEEAARRKAQEEEARRKAEEEAARRKAQEEEARRKAEEEAARRKAQEEEARRKAEEEAARRKAQEEEARRKAAEEKARRRAEEKARKAEEAARHKAEKDAAKRRAREEAATRRAEEQARKAAEAEKRKAEQDEARLLAEAKAARQAAAKAEQQRIKAEEVARQKAAEAQRRREAREQAERRREEQASKAAALAAAREREEATRKAMEEQAISRAARELSRQPAIKSTVTSVKSRMELPGSRKTEISRGRKRQPGAPNLYSLQAFRNTAEVKSRVGVAQRKNRIFSGVGGICLALTVLLTFLYMDRPVPPQFSGPTAVAIPPGQGPTLLAGDLLLMHDRAGMGTGQLEIGALGVRQAVRTMAFDEKGDLLLLLETPTNGEQAPPGTTLLRCQLEASQCNTVAGMEDYGAVRAFVSHPLDGSLFFLDSAEKVLVRIDSQGEISGRSALEMPESPVMQLQSGLLFMNSSAGPAISVFRYDSSAFGKQLDEILLVPAPAVEAEQNRVTDFLWNAGNWWVTLANTETGSSGVYRFSPDWNYLGQLALTPGTHPEQLVAWGEKTLVRDSRQTEIQRFNAAGAAEAPLVSEPLVAQVDQSRQRYRLSEIAWRAGLLTLGLTALTTLFLAWLQGSRALVYKGREARGAEPVDDLADQVSWIPPSPHRQDIYRRANIACTILAAALLLVAIGAGCSVMQLAALLLVIGGAAAALLSLQRSPSGHIGIVDGQLLLVDHANLYHMGGDARLQYRGPFMFLDDVAVHTGAALLPTFSPDAVDKNVAPIRQGGIRVDRKTVLVKLIQAKHPLVRACTWLLAGSLAALLTLALQWW